MTWFVYNTNQYIIIIIVIDIEVHFQDRIALRAATAREFLIFKADGEDLTALATLTGQCMIFQILLL